MNILPSVLSKFAEQLYGSTRTGIDRAGNPEKEDNRKRPEAIAQAFQVHQTAKDRFYYWPGFSIAVQRNHADLPDADGRFA